MDHWGPGSEKARIERVRQMTIGEKLRRMCELSAMLRSFHATAVRLRNPAATPREVHREWLRFILGEKLLEEILAAGRDPYQNVPEDWPCEADEPLIVEGRIHEPG
jgi:hypothetical protein